MSEIYARKPKIKNLSTIRQAGKAQLLLLADNLLLGYHELRLTPSPDESATILQ